MEKEARGEVVCNGSLRLLVRDPDFNTSRLIAKAINEHFPGSSVSVDGGAVQVKLPPDRCANPMSFVSDQAALSRFNKLVPRFNKEVDRRNTASRQACRRRWSGSGGSPPCSRACGGRCAARSRL